MLGFFADYLDLSDAQQAQIKQIMAKEKAGAGATVPAGNAEPRADDAAHPERHFR